MPIAARLRRRCFTPCSPPVPTPSSSTWAGPLPSRRRRPRASRPSVRRAPTARRRRPSWSRASQSPGGPPVADIAIRGATKIYDGAAVPAVDAVDLDIADGELLVLVGPSGCGQSTLLRMIAGLEEVTAGWASTAGRDVTYLPPKARDIAMVFQSYALYPHMTVRKNIGYPLKLAKSPKADIDRRVEETAQLLQLTDELERRPAQLSGGQRQRVAMGRAIVRHPQALLMGEPMCK